MPIVEITLFEGRDDETKDRLARQIADVVAEETGNAIADVHVLFREMSKGSWSRGLSLASRRAPSTEPPVRADFTSLSRIKYDPTTEQEYLALRRDAINPGMATQEGFVSSQLLRPRDRENEYLLIIKWLSEQHYEAYHHSGLHEHLRQNAMKILPRPLETVGADVVHLYPE
jgi:4-oxalocrotonate tautomerase